MAGEAERAQQLIERLLSDPVFRAEFRRDPEGAARASDSHVQHLRIISPEEARRAAGR